MDAQQAIERLYEDESLTSALEDSAAGPLMKWAERQLERLVQNAPDEPHFEQDFGKLKKLIKRIGRYIDRRNEWSEAEQADELAVIKGEAESLSAPLTIMTPSDYAKKPALEIVAAMIGAGTIQTAQGAIGVSDNPHDAPTTEVEQAQEADQTETRESPAAQMKGRESQATKEIPAPSIEAPAPPHGGQNIGSLGQSTEETPPQKSNPLGDLIKRIFEE